MTANAKAKQPEIDQAVNAAAQDPAADNNPQTTGKKAKVISHPNDVAAVVMAQMNAVNAKKDELTIAIKGLTDITQQLARAYAGQVQVIQQLNTRLKTLEASSENDKQAA